MTTLILILATLAGSVPPPVNNPGKITTGPFWYNPIPTPHPITPRLPR